MSEGVIIELITSKELCEKLGKNSRGLTYLMKKSKNPFPKPAMGGIGHGNQRKWKLPDVTAWELKEYGFRTIG